MNTDKAHCTGQVGERVCSIREKCERYHLHLDAKGQKRYIVPYLNHAFNLGYGRVFTADITNGCCEYINIDKSK